jgi:hypothetical protein
VQVAVDAHERAEVGDVGERLEPVEQLVAAGQQRRDRIRSAVLGEREHLLGPRDHRVRAGGRLAR